MGRKKRKETDKYFPVRVSREMWIALRRLQERRVVESLQDATEQGLRLLLKDKNG